MINIPATLRQVQIALENETKEITDIAKLFYLKEKLLKIESIETTSAAQFTIKLCVIQVCKQAMEKLNNADNIPV